MPRPRDLLFSIPTLLALPSFVAAAYDCEKVLADDQTFNLKTLGGPHNVHWIKEEPPSLTNLTFTIDICQTLKVPEKNKKDACPEHTRVCGIEYDYNLEDGGHMIRRVIPIAGNFTSDKDSDPIVTRLKPSESTTDSQEHGIQIELQGGRYPLEDETGRSQKAIVKFLCDPKRSGLGGDEPAKNERRSPEEEKKSENKEGKKEEDDKKDLRFISYQDEKGTDVLRLEWKTEHACTKQEDSNPSPGGHWGFFTWFIIILFLGTATYLIFGSWLNYTRYGARGWDLLPHGDTIRDMPYLMKDWGRRVVNTVQGGGSRGGYSAV